MSPAELSSYYLSRLITPLLFLGGDVVSDDGRIQPGWLCRARLNHPDSIRHAPHSIAPPKNRRGAAIISYYTKFQITDPKFQSRKPFKMLPHFVTSCTHQRIAMTKHRLIKTKRSGLQHTLHALSPVLVYSAVIKPHHVGT